MAILKETYLSSTLCSMLCALAIPGIQPTPHPLRKYHVDNHRGNTHTSYTVPAEQNEDALTPVTQNLNAPSPWVNLGQRNH